MADNNGRSKDSNDPNYTVDGDQTQTGQMPGITRLLNRKKLGLSTPSAASVPVPTPPSSPIPTAAPAQAEKVEAAPREIVISDSAETLEFELRAQIGSASPPSTEAPGEAPALSVAKVQRAKNVERRSPERLKQWNSSELSSGTTPIEKALVVLMAQGGKSSLWMELKGALPPAESTLCFGGTAFLGSREQAETWTGLKWTPGLTPDLWEQLSSVRYLEFAPPGPETLVTSSRNLIRAAFGVQINEFLLLLPAGSQQGIHGVLAVLSQVSLVTIAKRVLPVLEQYRLQQDPLKKAA